MGPDAVERAGLRYPPGNPDDFITASDRLARASADLQTVPARVQRLAQLGESWTGAAAEWFRAGAARSASTISDVSGALRVAALAARAAGEALQRQQRAARRLAEQVNEAEREYQRAERDAERAEESAEQARNRAAQATAGAGLLGGADPFSLAEQARASREAQTATQQATEARERADRARERYADLQRRADRELTRLEEDTERADQRARTMLDEVGRTLAAVADPSADLGDCPLDTPLFTTGAGLLPFLTHGGRLARDALANPWGPLAGSARTNAYNTLAEGLREVFPGTCIGPEPPTPPNDPPDAQPEPVRPTPEPADEPGWFERRLDDVTSLPGEVKDIIEDTPGAVEDGYQAYDRWTDQALQDAGDWLEDQLPAPSDGPLGPLPLPPLPMPGPG